MYGIDMTTLACLYALTFNMEILDLVAPIYKFCQSQRNPYTHVAGDTESERLLEYTGLASYKISLWNKIGATTASPPL